MIFYQGGGRMEGSFCFVWMILNVVYIIYAFFSFDGTPSLRALDYNDANY